MNSAFRIPHSAFEARPWLGMIVILETFFCISCWLTVVPISGRDSYASLDRLLSRDEEARVGKYGSVASALLGESRLALSGHFYEMADMYFHKGVEHVHTRAFESGIFQKLLKDISPERHVHLGGQEVKEIMPWLWLAIHTDPHNIDIYLVAAFWLARECGRPDLAIEVLREAQCNNPFNYQIQLDKGCIYLKEKKLEEARQAFDAALAFWSHNENPHSRDAQEGKATILLYRALLHEANREKEQAIKRLSEILEMFPGRTHLKQRIEMLEKGDQPSLLASQYLDVIMKKDGDRREDAMCPYGDHEHECED